MLLTKKLLKLFDFLSEERVKHLALLRIHNVDNNPKYLGIILMDEIEEQLEFLRFRGFLYHYI